MRNQLKQVQRKEWDASEDDKDTSCLDDVLPYISAEQAYTQLTRLLRYVDVQDPADQKRLQRTFSRLKKGALASWATYVGGPWPMVYLRLQNTCLRGLERSRESEPSLLFQKTLEFTTQAIPELTTKNAQYYYTAIRHALLSNSTCITTSIVAAPLQHLGPFTELAYQSLAIKLLPLPNLFYRGLLFQSGSASIEELAERLNCKLLTSSLSNLIQSAGNVPVVLSRSASKFEIWKNLSPDLVTSSAWLAAHLIFLNRQSLGYDHPERFASTSSFIFVICALLSFIADNLPRNKNPLDSDVENVGLLHKKGFDRFILEQIDALVNQKAIASLIYQMNFGSGEETSNSQVAAGHGDRTRALATYILTLLRLYPNRGDDIRMWLYIGSSPISHGDSSSSGPTAVKFFWQASRSSSIFQRIHDDARTAVELLKPQTFATPAQLSRDGRPQNTAKKSTENEWQIILLFIEMYSFVLKVMDDEEFFSYDSDALSFVSPMASSGRQNSLRLDEIKTLGIFLKHLGYTMYYNAADIIGTRDEESGRDIHNFFKAESTGQAESESRRIEKRNQTTTVSGVNLDYLKGAVAGLLRAIYERDSRRPFMPKEYWLMNLRFDTGSFIDAVVEEEERRHQVQEAAEEDDADDSDDHWDITRSPGLVGSGHAQQLQKLENLRRQQRKESRQRHLQAVAPRLEILQNMPFLIPFTTRVQIFRRFIHLDQMKRRNGTTDPEMWRLSQMHSFSGNSLERHHARVRRGQEFEDAFEQFYDLGASLKEPIHITFLDQFNQEEAGIDGGGVTKEFLTSVTNQAFSEHDGVKLFVENEKHLLFPNPAAVDEQEELIKEAGFKKDTAEFRSHISDMFQRYEFLGRIIGKCLYEGILIDIGFAGFFLLKWALTGGSGSAPKESGYRANINDLRDFDEELYQGLLKLKNYPGDVEDFALNFTVADTLSIPSQRNRERTKVINRELRPGGNNLAVTNANRLVYISYMARHRLSSQPYRQTNAFLKGLGSMISPSWLSMFNQQELQTLVGGAASAINVGDLRANTSYGGVYTIGSDGLEHESVQLFWQVMESLPDDDRRKVLKFVTSTPRAPLLGFGSLTPRFSIRDSGSDNTRLPSTSTCVNLLKLPRYQTFEVCRTKLLQAVNAGAGFDLS